MYLRFKSIVVVPQLRNTSMVIPGRHSAAVAGNGFN